MSLKLTFSLILNVLTCMSDEKCVSVCEVVLMPVLKHRQTLEINVTMTAKFVKKHVYKIYRENISIFGCMIASTGMGFIGTIALV